jgi:GntR family transcriptional regulator/MocR family aminotransferase
MPSEWTTSQGLDLHLALTGTGGRRAAIEEALRAAVRDGRLTAGMQLPSTRALARDLAVARGTVTDAYDQLVAEGWLVAHRGSGTSVAWAPVAEAPSRVRLDVAPVGDEARHNFRPGSPDLSAFPRQEWLAALRRALKYAPDATLGYSDVRGLAPVRETVAGYIARARGVRTTGERIVICSGFAQALTLLCAALRELGASSVAMEDPCIPSYRASADRAGLDVRALRVDADGADPAGLDGAGAAFLTPAHQYPMGVTLAPPRRAQFTEWARAAGAYLIEDDYDGEFRYDRQPVGALQGMDPERVAYVGTASKSLAPGLRLGWIALPPSLVEPVVAAKEIADRHAGALDQLALSELITSGALDRHVRRSRLRYRRRRDELLARLSTVPAIRVEGIAAGLHVVIGLPEVGPREKEVEAGLSRAGVAVHGLGFYWHRPGRRPAGIVVGHGTPPEHAFPSAVAALTDALAGFYR